MFSNLTGYISSGRKANDAEYNIQTNLSERLGMIDSAGQSDSIFGGLFGLNEADKANSSSTLMNEFMRNANLSIEESSKKEALEDIRDSFTIG